MPSLGQLAQITGAELVGDPEYVITGVASLEEAIKTDISFLANMHYKEALDKSHAGAICVAPGIELVQGKNFLVSENPSRTFQQIVEHLIRKLESGFCGIHPTAAIHASVVLGKDVEIGPYVVIDQGSTIGDRTRLAPHVCIGAGVFIGEDCLLHAHAVVREGCKLGSRVILQPGAIIGSCGFGYTTDAQGHHQKLDQLGIVILEDDVEIGANTTIDRARFKVTRIGRGTKIDNLVQIGHNVIIGEHNIIVSQTGIAGSVKTGRYVVFGGQTGVTGHAHITDNVMIGAQGGVSKSITKSGKYAGSPVLPLNEHNKQQVLLRKIKDFADRLKALEEHFFAGQD